MPKRDDAPLCGLKSDKDFLTANAVDAILTLPKRKVEPTPDWLAKAEYGKAPTYLARIKGEIEAEHEFIQVRCCSMRHYVLRAQQAATASSFRLDLRRCICHDSMTSGPRKHPSTPCSLTRWGGFASYSVPCLVPTPTLTPRHTHISFVQSLLDQKQMEEEAASGVRMRELTSGEREELVEALKQKCERLW